MSGKNERFNAEALQWDSKPETVQSSQALFEYLVSRLPELSDKSKRLAVLDLGCGTGLLSQRLAQCEGVASIVGVDTSEGMIDVFNSKQNTVPQGDKMKGITKLLEDPEDPVLEGQKFDIAVTHLALHHIPDMQAVVNTLAHTLKPDKSSKLLLSDFLNDGQHALLFHHKSKHNSVERHGVAKEEMSSLLQQSGLHDTSVEISFVLDKTTEVGKEKFSFILGVGSQA